MLEIFSKKNVHNKRPVIFVLTGIVESFPLPYYKVIIVMLRGKFRYFHLWLCFESRGVT